MNIKKKKQETMESDDDLLALAGVSGSEDEGYEPTATAGKKGGVKRRLNDSDDEDDDDGNEDDDDEMGLDDDGEEDNDDDDGAEGDPYPLENKYKDEKDKAELMAMDEIRREQILYDRLQEREKFRERKYLALRAKQSKVEKSALKKGSTSKSLRTSRLSELKKQRERKNRKRTGEDYEDEEEESEDDRDLEELAGYGDEEDYEDDYYLSSRSRSKRSDEYDESSYKIATFEEFQKIRTTRENLNKFLYRDEFEQVIPGTMVRLSVGKQNNKLIYRIARVESVKRGGKIYQFYGKPCNTYLELSQAQSTHIVEMSYISDSPFTNEEFKIYESKLGEYQMKLPTVREVRDKLDELKAMSTRKLTDEDINKIVQRKEELAVNTLNSAGRVRRVTRLREELQVALEQGHSQKVAEIKQELDKLSKISQQNSNSSVSKLAEINIRNQKSNQEYIRKAEQRNAELRRKQLMNNDFNDPFSRLRTNPKLFYSSTTQASQEDGADDTQKTEDAAERELKYKTSVFRNEGIDSLIKTIKLDLDVDL